MGRKQHSFYALKAIFFTEKNDCFTEQSTNTAFVSFYPTEGVTAGEADFNYLLIRS